VLYRIGRLPDPLAWPPWDYVGTGRFDDPAGEFRVLYATVQRRTGFLETLARFRPSLEVLAALEGVENTDEPFPMPQVPADWYHARAIGRLRLRTRQRWLDLRGAPLCRAGAVMARPSVSNSTPFVRRIIKKEVRLPMGTVVSDISISLDGYITGPNDRPDQGLGEGGRVLHEWIFKDPATFPKLMAGLRASTGALIMGRRSYENAEGWGDEPPFHLPIFVVTHRSHERVEKKGGTRFTFVTDGLESALRQARTVAGDRDVGVHGGSVARQLLRAGLLDELKLHIVPVLLGAGNRLFEDGELQRIDLESVSANPTPDVIHLHYRVSR